MEVLWCLRESVHQKRPEKWWDGNWILHHNNAPAHTSHLLQQFLAYMAPLSCNSHHTRQTSHGVTFSYSRGLRKFWKDTDLRQRRTSNEIRRRHYQTSRKRSLQSLSNSGRTSGEGYSCRRELCWRQLGFKNPVSFIYFMYCGQSGYFLNRPRITSN